MKFSAKTLIAAALAASIIAPASAQQVQKLSATKANEYGLVYTLPTTVVDVTLEVELTTQLPGEFARYARKYLNASNPITEESHSARLISATITTHGEANPEQRYVITLKSTQTPFILLTPDGRPLAINTETIATVDKPQLPVSRPAEPTPLQTKAAHQVMTEEMIQSHSTAKRAELAAQQLYALRQTRTDLITGQADQMPPDGRAMELVTSTLDAQEAALVAMFMGTTSVSTQVATVSFTPSADADNVSNIVIARISPTDGIVAADDLSGAPVTLSMKTISRGELPISEKGEELPFPKGGIAYTIPGQADITVDYEGRKVASARVDVAALGTVYGMAPANFTDKKSAIFARFDPATGAIVITGPKDQ